MQKEEFLGREDAVRHVPAFARVHARGPAAGGGGLLLRLSVFGGLVDIVIVVGDVVEVWVSKGVWAGGGGETLASVV